MKQIPIKINYVEHKFVLWILLGLFFIPLFLAIFLYYSGSLSGVKRTNYGQLIQPPLHTNALPFITQKNQAQFHRWLLIYFIEAPCNQICKRDLYLLRQMHVSLGKDANRVMRIIVIEQSVSSPQLISDLQRSYPNSEIHLMNKQQLQQFFAAQKGMLKTNTDALLIADPLGNVILYNAQNFVAKGVLADLRRLLKYSHIG